MAYNRFLGRDDSADRRPMAPSERTLTIRLSEYDSGFANGFRWRRQYTPPICQSAHCGYPFCGSSANGLTVLRDADCERYDGSANVELSAPCGHVHCPPIGRCEGWDANA